MIFLAVCLFLFLAGNGVCGMAPLLPLLRPQLFPTLNDPFISSLTPLPRGISWFHCRCLTCEHNSSYLTGQILQCNALRTNASCLDKGCVRWSKILLPDPLVWTWWGVPSIQNEHHRNAWTFCKVIMSSLLQPPTYLSWLSSVGFIQPTHTILQLPTPRISLSFETWLRNWHRKSLNGYQTFRGATCTLWGLNMCLEETTSAITTWPLQRPSLLCSPHPQPPLPPFKSKGESQSG